MPPQFRTTSIPLFKSNGIPAMSAGCCCGVDPCLCTVPKVIGFGSNCPCLEVAYGPIKQRGATTFTITGTTVGRYYARFNDSPGPLPPSNPRCPPPSVCADIAGSYVVECDTQAAYQVYTYVCSVNEGFPFFRQWNIYYATTIVLTSLVGNVRGISCEIRSGAFLAGPGYVNPYPTITISPLSDLGIPGVSVGGTYLFPPFGNVPAYSWKTWQRPHPLSVVDDWFWDPAYCTDPCNQIVQRAFCDSGTLTPAVETAHYAPWDSCGLEDISIAVSIGAATDP